LYISYINKWEASHKVNFKKGILKQAEQHQFFKDILQPAFLKKKAFSKNFFKKTL